MVGNPWSPRGTARSSVVHVPGVHPGLRQSAYLIWLNSGSHPLHRQAQHEPPSQACLLPQLANAGQEVVAGPPFVAGSPTDKVGAPAEQDEDSLCAPRRRTQPTMRAKAAR